MRPQELALLGGLPLVVAVAWTVSPGAWPRLCRAVIRQASGNGLPLRRQVADLEAAVRRALSGRPVAADPREIAIGALAADVETLLQLIRTRRPGGWRPEVALDDRPRLESALAHGRGALLLLHHFRRFVHLPALAATGLPVTRLSDAAHGFFSASVVGRRWLNRLQATLEHPPGVHRIVVRRDSVAHFRQVEERLRQNSLVVIGALPGGLRPVAAPFLNGQVTLASAPFSLAAKLDVPLLPLYPIREGREHFRLFVGEAVRTRDGSGRPRPVEQAIREHLEELERWVLRFPNQWRVWQWVQAR